MTAVFSMAYITDIGVKKRIWLELSLHIWLELSLDIWLELSLDIWLEL